ncbi:platelet-activating factor acetyltransferase activity protein [Trebouxia sp. C0009 RCD-2024]
MFFNCGATCAVQGVDLVFYGDSLTKLWRSIQPQINGVPEVFTAYFGNYSAAILGVGEDQASNLLWRMQHGEMFVRHPPKVAIVLIGTNDLGAGGSCSRGEPGATAAANGTALRVQEVVTYLQGLNPDTHIILMGLLPWGLVNQAGVYDWPNLYTEGISIVNSAIESFAVGQRTVHYIDCGHVLYPDGQVSTAAYN